MAKIANDAILPGAILLRPTSPADNEFLLHVYASTRQEEMAKWGWCVVQQSAFIRMQYDVRKRSYATAYPSAEFSLVLVDGVPAGSMIVFRGSSEIRLLDIALLPEFRGRGIGEELIRRLISEAARSKSPVRLSVLRGNRAARLYERLGFVAKSGDQMYSQMECFRTPSLGGSGSANETLESVSNAGKSE
jgi:ribosomal protein S18 acetylase RimI-like enzyme